MINYFFKKICVLFFYLILSFSNYSCKEESKFEIKQSIVTSKFQNLLEHYKEEEKDSLKYKSVKYLLSNVSYYGHYEESQKFEKVFDSIENYLFEENRGVHFLSLLKQQQRFGVRENCSFVSDVESINSKELMIYIDGAFEAWNLIPEEKRASFDDFCEFILPYKVGNEPFDFELRPKLREKYTWVLELLKEGKSLRFAIDSLISKSNIKLQEGINKYYPCPLSLDQMSKVRRGACDDMVMYFVNVLRSLGLISAKDYVPHWGNHHSTGHSWLYVKYGKEEYACNIDVVKSKDLFEKYKKNSIIPKIYRTGFEVKGNIFALGSKDVSKDYFSTIDFKVDNAFQTVLKNPVLCVFDSRREWSPVGLGISESNHVKFTNVGVEGEILFMVLTESNNGKIPINYPFYFVDNEIVYLKPDKSNLKKITLKRKYGLTSPRENFKLKRIKMLNSGFFEASNEESFNNPTLLYQISNLNSTHLQKRVIKNENKYKFIRFNSNEKKAYLANLKFFDKNGNLLKGKVYGENLREGLKGMNAFDDNQLTYTGGTDFTIGLNLEHPKEIGFIEFQARNDDNHINVGEEYELMFWDKKWNTLGKQIANDTVLYYNVHPNTLLRLKNNTKGIEEHVFILGENGQQKWLGFDDFN